MTTRTSTKASIESYWKDDFAPLEAAGKVLLRELREDEADGDLQRRILSPGSHLYFSSPSFQHERSVQLPPALATAVKSVKASLLMGLLPEADLAWMSVDNKLYLWSFEHEADFMHLEITSGQSVVSVGLAPPKKGVFNGMVEWCLVVTTPDEIVLCAIANREGSRRIVQTRYTLPTDSIPIVTICGIHDGRIFMGGYDGGLYEFSYESLLEKGLPAQKNLEQSMKDFYDGSATSVQISKSQGPGMASKVVSSGKRAIASMLTTSDRPPKCRKLNHSANGVAAVANAVVPDWLLKVPSALFGSGKVSPLVKIAHDAERKCLYTMTDRGIVGVYDLRSKELMMKAKIDCDKAARLYLSAVAKGHMYVSSSSVEFAGGGSSAQAGVGGMDGARSILKLADTDVKANILTPVSLHVLPRSESGRLTLLVVTAGGLRYYLTCLSSSMNRSALAPSSKIVMHHIRAPPPVDPVTGTAKESFDEGDVPGGLIPRLLPHTSVDSSAYSGGHLFLALRKPQAQNGNREVGNTIVGTTADFIYRKVTKKENLTIRERPGGVTETVSVAVQLLPGGRIVDSSAMDSSSMSPIVKLMLNSQTPSDGELSVGLVPPFYPKLASKKKPERKLTRKPSSSSIAVANSSTLAITSGPKISGSVIVARVFANFLLSRPLCHGLAVSGGSTSSNGVAQPELYRISNRYGSGGFSSSAGGKVSSNVSVGSGSTHKSSRLSPWLLCPSMVPLNSLTLSHLQSPSRTTALSVGGLHFFKSQTILTTLEEALMSANTDEKVAAFYDSYGAKQFCSMCLTLAIGSGPAQGGSIAIGELKERAQIAAFYRGGLPKLKKKPNSEDMTDPYMEDVSSDALVPKGYDFVASDLSDSVVCLSSRLLRPIWYKPAVVVTEGQKIKTIGSVSKQLPAKVELLLDNATLESVRAPLFGLTKLMASRFQRALEVVPGTRKVDTNQMEVDESSILTGSMLFQGALRGQGVATDSIPRDELEATARLIEERNLHSLYRLVSRSVQLLDLLSLLKRAQAMPDLAEVEWGLLHGLTFSQLVQTQDGQQRIETLLNALVSNSRSFLGVTVTPSADADLLAKSLTTQCYLFFSPASRFSYLGFRTANEAMSCEPMSTQRATKATQAVDHFKSASSFWTSAQLITGRIMHSGEVETLEQKVSMALQYDSPLAKAAAILAQLDEVVALVDISTATASNFRGKKAAKVVDDQTVGYPWEKSLYHERKTTDTASQGNNSKTSFSAEVIAVGTTVTPQEAIATCHAIILHHLMKVLKGNNERTKRNMIAACAASPDKEFLRAFFEYLLTTKHQEYLLLIDSPELEKWLNESQDIELMWQHFIKQRKFAKAGDLMWKKATDENPLVLLDTRIMFLERSESAYNSAAGKDQLYAMADTKVHDFQGLKNRASEHLDVARLQKQTIDNIKALHLETQLDVEKQQALEMTLLAVSVLYNDYTAPLNLFEISLKIMLSCKHNDPAIIETLWKSVICQEILPCCTRSEVAYQFLQSLMSDSLIQEQVDFLTDGQSGDSLPLFEMSDWLPRLKESVGKLGLDLYGHGHDYVFPVPLLVASMEGLRHASTTTSSVPWPLHTLSVAGVSFPDLLASYELIVEREERSVMGGGDPVRRFLSLKSMVEMLEEWVSVAGNASTNNRALRELRTSARPLALQVGSFKASLDDLRAVAAGNEVGSVLNRLVRVEDSIRQLTS